MTTKATRLYKVLGKAHFKRAAMREDGLITHDTTADDVVSHQRQTEREAFEIASGQKRVIKHPHKDDFNANQYKKCSKCKQSRKLQYFGVKHVKNKLGRVAVYYQSWCNFCVADWVAEERRKSVLILRE